MYLESGAAAKLSIAALDSRNIYDVIPMDDTMALLGVTLKLGRS